MQDIIKICPLWPGEPDVHCAGGPFYECRNIQCKFQQDDKCAFLWTLALCFEDIDSAVDEILDENPGFKN